MLERIDSSIEYWEGRISFKLECNTGAVGIGKRGAAIGAFQQIVAGRESKEFLRDIITMLKNTTNPQAEYVLKVIRKWGKD